MTAVCTGGTSAPKSGYAQQITLDTSGVAAALAIFGFPEAAAALALVIGAIVLYLPTFCATDPPADPTLTAADVQDALNFTDVATSLPAIDRIRQWFQRQYWYQVCECTSGTAIAPSPPSDPGDIGTNTGIPGRDNVPCQHREYTASFPPPASGSVVTDMTGKLLNISGASVTRTGSIGGNVVSVTAWPVDATIQRFHVESTTIAKDSHYSVGNGAQISWLTFNSAGTQLDAQLLFQANDTVPTASTTVVQGVTGSWTSTATHFAIASNINHIAGATITEIGNLVLDATCAGTPTPEPCCPPDPLVTTKLDQIYATLISIYQGIPAPLTSYSAGTAHAGLHDNGFFTIATAGLAYKVELTTIPTYLGEQLGDPLYFFEAGFTTAAGAEGPYSSERVTFSTQVFLLPELTTEIHYSLAGGVVATITELHRGP